MPFEIETSLEGFFPSQSTFTGQSTTVLYIHWNASRRVYLQTSNEILPLPEDESLGPRSGTNASFDLLLGSASDLDTQIRRSLASLNFTYSVTSVLNPKITAFTLRFATSRSSPPYPYFIVFADLNFVEKFYVDSIHRPLAESRLVGEIFILGTSMEEDWDGSDDEEGEEDDSEGASDSAIETLRRRKLDRRGGEEESYCSVCLETFSNGEKVISLRCEDIYHESCIVTWLKKSQCCPICRRRNII